MSNSTTSQPIIAAGIDLSWRTKSETAIAWLNGEPEGHPQLIRLPSTRGLRGKYGDGRLTAMIIEGQPVVVAIDAPLELPHPLTCRDSTCPTCLTEETVSPDYSRRQLERRERWRAVFPGMTGPMATSMLAGIAFRGIYLRRVLVREGIRVIETWPMGVLRALQHGVGDATASMPSAERRDLLATVVDNLDRHLEPDSSSYPHQLDAIAAAYAAWSCAANQAVSISCAGFEDEGQIWLPLPAAG